MATISDKQAEYLADLVQINLVNRTWTTKGLTGDQSRRLQAEMARRIRAEMDEGEMDGARAATLISAVKGYPYGPRALLVALELTERDELATIIGD